MQGPPSIDEQIAWMASTWPRFRLVARRDAIAEWQGELRPLMCSFHVSIAYRARHVIEALDPRRSQPMVRVLDPPLRPRPGDPEGQLPHVYYTGPGALDVVLCMFDPDADEWSPYSNIAETTLPWTVEWLASYEGWRATGQWTGGGRHLDSPRLDEASQ